MMSSVDMEASWSSSASSTAMAAGAGAGDDIARLIASGSERKGACGVGLVAAAALDFCWKKIRCDGLASTCARRRRCDGRSRAVYLRPGRAGPMRIGLGYIWAKPGEMSIGLGWWR